MAWLLSVSLVPCITTLLSPGPFFTCLMASAVMYPGVVATIGGILQAASKKHNFFLLRRTFMTSMFIFVFSL